MDGWIFQGGFPLVEVTDNNDSASLTVSQRPMSYDDSVDDRTWLVPLQSRPIDTSLPVGFDPATAPASRLLLGSDSASVPAGSAGVVVNAGGHGFYRVAYDADTLSNLAAIAAEGLAPVERYALVDDAWASVLAGRLSAVSFLNLLEAMSAETDSSVVRRILSGWRSLDRWCEGDARDELRTIVHDALAPTLASIGLDPSPDDDDRDRQLRADLLVALATLANDGDLQQHAASLVGAEGDAALAAAAVTVVARTGDQSDFDSFVTHWRNATTPQDEVRYLYALPEFDTPQTAAEIQRLIRTGEVRSQNAGLVIGALLGQRVTGRDNFTWVRSEWDYLNDFLPTSMIVRMVGSLPLLDQPDDVTTAAAFFAENPIPQAGKTLDQVLERQRVATTARARESTPLQAFLTS